MSIDWGAIEHLNLWDHQKEAIEAIHTALHRHSRAQLLLTMGGGKSRINIALMHQFIRDVMGDIPGQTQKKLVVVLFVPTLTLLRQFREEVDELLRVPHRVRVHAMASDQGVAQGDIRLSEIGITPTTSGMELRRKLYEPEFRDAVEIVFSTYDSAHETKLGIGTTRRQGVHTLVILDEGHRSEAPSYRAAREIECDWMLSQTGTQGQEMAIRTDLYGPVAYDLPQPRAQELGIVRKYDLVALPVRKSDLEALVAPGSGSPYEGLKIRDAAMIYMMECLLDDPRYEIKAGIGFFERITKSKLAAKILSSRKLSNGRRIDAQHLDGTMSVVQRSRILRNASENEPNTIKLVLNAQALTEGINFVASNATFLEKARGPKPTAQAIARSLRIIDDPDRRGVVGKVLVVNDDDPDQPFIEPWSLEDFLETVKDIKVYHDKIDRHIVVPDSPAPPPPERRFSRNIDRQVYEIQNDAIMRVVRDAVETVRASVRPIAGRRYRGVSYDPKTGKWRALLRNPFKGPKPESPAMGRYDPDAYTKLREWEAQPDYLLDELFDYASDAAEAYDRIIDQYALPYQKNFGRNPLLMEIDPQHVPGVHQHAKGTWEAQIYVPTIDGGKKRISRTVRSAGDSLRAQIALAARYGILNEFLERTEAVARKKVLDAYRERGEDPPAHLFKARFLPPEEEINFSLILSPQHQSKHYEGVEQCPAQGWWAYTEDTVGRIISLGHYPTEHLAGEVARRAREILERETPEQHLAEGVLAIGERVRQVVLATLLTPSAEPAPQRQSRGRAMTP